MKFNTKDTEERMQKSVNAYASNLSTIRASQANTAIVSKVTFEYYGAQTPLKDMADIRQADSRTLEIKPYDGSTLKAMEKAILASDVGITPANDGQKLRLVFPQPTEERRKELCKQVSKMAEEAKVAVRNIRRDANDLIKKMQKDSQMTEDEAKSSEKSIQDLTDKFIKQIDANASKKQSEVMAI